MASESETPTPPEPPRQGLRLEAVDWRAALPFVNLFQSFRLAINPPQLLLCLLLVLGLFLGGRLMDTVHGPGAYTNELSNYLAMPTGKFSSYISIVGQDEPTRGVFDQVLHAELDAFGRLINAAVTLRPGLGDWWRGRTDPDSIIGAVRDAVFRIPGWMCTQHPLFFAGYLVLALVLWALLGGAAARLCAVRATVGEHIGLGDAVRFSTRRLGWLLLTPLLPPLLMLAVGLLLALAGLVFFNLPGLDIIGGLAFGLLLLGGLVIALLLIGHFAGAGLLYPAIAVEDADAFDAVSRAYNYALGRPWRWLFYNLAALGYGALTYLFLGLVVFLTLWVTRFAVEVGSFRDAASVGTDGQAVTWDYLSRFAAALPDSARTYSGGIPFDELPVTAKITHALLSVWINLLFALLAAYAISFYFAANTWVYLLLRKASDGTGYREVAAGAEQTAAEPTAPEKVEATPDSGGAA